MLTPEPISQRGYRRNVPMAAHSGAKRSLRGHAPRDAVAAGVVAAVLALGKDVGSEDRACFGRHDVVDPALVGAVVEVVDALVALVAKPAVVLEADRPCHGAGR